MLHVDEVTSDWSVLLAMSETENARLLSVILDGFGYAPLECRDNNSVFEHLSKTTPFAAVVDLRLADSDEICNLVVERGGVSLVVLLEDDEKDPEEIIAQYGAEAWESVDASPENILFVLRQLANQSSPVG